MLILDIGREGKVLDKYCLSFLRNAHTFQSAAVILTYEVNRLCLLHECELEAQHSLSVWLKMC